MRKNMTQNNEITARPSRDYGSSLTTLRLVVSLLLTLLGVVYTWGQTEITSLSQITSADGNYVITDDISGGTTGTTTFTGTLTARAKADGTFPVISGIENPLFKTATDATISNIMLKSVSIKQKGYVGAIACTANGNTRIYNCGILPTTAKHEATGQVLLYFSILSKVGSKLISSWQK